MGYQLGVDGQGNFTNHLTGEEAKKGLEREGIDTSKMTGKEAIQELSRQKALERMKLGLKA